MFVSTEAKIHYLRWLGSMSDRLRGKKPKLSPTQEKHLVELWRAVEHTSAELASEFGVARSTVYRAVERAGVSTRTKEGASA